MYAVIETGGKQVRVQVGQVVKVELLDGDVGSEIVFDKILMVGGDGDDDVKIGSPAIEGAEVRGSVVEQDRGPKIRLYTYKRRQNSNRKSGGHRQSYTAVKIDAIQA